MLIDLKDKIAIITGAGRGIGRSIAQTLASEGVKVVVTDIKDELLEDVKTTWEQYGWEGMQLKSDVRDATQCKQVVADVEAHFGRLDILVNNAGVAMGGAVETLSEGIWDANIDINLKGTFLMCQAAIPIMKRQRYGRILNAASFAAVIPSLESAAYASSKFGVHGFTRVLAGELGPWDITVNCYAPGMIPTELNNFAGQTPERQSELLDTLTLRRWGTTDEIANLICFLASDQASYITGAMIEVTGGKFATQIPKLAYKNVTV
jgi:3-oxoacyl-[acyl-carrier protein] reductase